MAFTPGSTLEPAAAPLLPSSSTTGRSSISELVWRKLSCISPLVVANIMLMLVSSGGPFLLRVYFVYGGQRIWLTTAIQLFGFPILLIPIALSPRHPGKRPMISLPIAGALASIGLIMAACSYLNALGSSYLPLSTSSLLGSTQLVFTAFFALLLVRQKITSFSMNAVMVLTIASVVLGLGSGSDKIVGESQVNYVLGFAAMLASSALNGVMLPLIELVMAKWAEKADGMNYRSVMEMLLLIEISGSVFSFTGMAINGDYMVIAEEARRFFLGESGYCWVVIGDAIFWQLYNMGLLGVISSSSSLLGGIMAAVVLTLTELLAIVFLHESFTGNKAVAFVLSVWGFASYVYGEHKQKDQRGCCCRCPSIPEEGHGVV